MATIGKLKVVLTARTSAFAKGMRRAGTAVRKFGSRAKAAVASTKLLGGSLVGLAAGGGLAYLGSRSANTIDKLGKTADKLGATTEGLATMRHAAKLSGVEVNTFDMALQRLVKRVGLVNAGQAKMGKTAKMTARFFRALGLDTKKLAAMPADEIFREWATALGKVGNASERVAYAFKFVDSEGVAVVNMLQAVGAGWKDTVRLAESLGIRLTRTQVRLVERMNDAFFNLRTKTRAIMDQTLVRVAPVLEAVFKKITAMIPHPARAAEWLVGKLKGLGESFLRFADWVYPAALKLASGIVWVAESLTKLVIALDNIPLVTIPDSFREMASSLALFREGIKMTLDDFYGKRGASIFDRVTTLFKMSVRDAKAAAREYAASRIATGRQALEDVAGAVIARSATIRSATVGEIGGLTGAGGRPGTVAWFGGSVQLKLAGEHLAETKAMHATIKQQGGRGLRS